MLVDEYDKPILDALEEPSVARAKRDYLQGLYGMMKSCDAHIRFCFLTGVSKVSKASLFSGLNDLRGITLNARLLAICVYTEGDLDTMFAPELLGLDRERIRDLLIHRRGVPDEIKLASRSWARRHALFSAPCQGRARR